MFVRSSSRGEPVRQPQHVCPAAIGIAAILIPVLLLPGCGGASLASSGAFEPAEAAAKAIEIYDANGDGRLSVSEVDACPSLAGSRRRLDADRSGELTAEEIQARMEELSKGADYIGLDVQLLYKDRPLEGAELTLTPEPFMGEQLQSYKGVTVGGGGCPLKGENRRTPGIPIGFYIAKIVHAEQGIDETRGCEIADDTTGNRLLIEL